MKTENILIILALFVVIFLLFSNFSVATPTAPIVFQTPSFLSNSLVLTTTLTMVDFVVLVDLLLVFV